MPREDEEPAGEEENPMVEGRLLVVTTKVAVPELLDQQTKVIMREVVGDISEVGEMAEVEEMVVNVTGVISGETDHLSVLRQTKLDRGVHMLHNQRKQRHLPKKKRTLQKQGKP